MSYLSGFVFLLATVLLEAASAKQHCTHQMDLAFLVDSSGSICNESEVPCDNWRACLAFIHAIVNDMTIGENDVRVALTLFQTTPFPQWKLSTYYDKSSLLKAIDNLGYRIGTTNTIAALDTLSTTFRPENGDRPNVRNVVMLITDGKPNIDNVLFSMDQIRAAVKRVTDQGIQLLAVGVTDSIDMVTLKELSSEPHKISENVFFAKNYQSLQTVLKQLENQKCFNVPDPIVLPDSHCSDANVDLALLIDGSGSICDYDQGFNKEKDITCNNWSLMLQFVHRIIDGIFVSPHTRVGLVTFRSQAKTVFNLEKYTDKQALLSAVDNMKYEKWGETDMTGALHLMRTEVFNTAGDRPGIPNKAVIITDGFATKPSTLQSEIDAARSSNIRILPIGVTNRVDESTLQRLSAQPPQLNVTYFEALDYAHIESIRKLLQERICQ